MSDTNPTPRPGNFLSGPTYDLLKKVVQLVLPAIGTLYFTLAGIWGWDGGEQVVGSVAALSLFFGVILALSNKAYNDSEAKYDGSIDIVEHTDRPTQAIMNLKNYENPADVVNKSEVTFKVNRIPGND